MAQPRVFVVDDCPGARYRRMRILLDDGFLPDTAGPDALLAAVRAALAKDRA